MQTIIVAILCHLVVTTPTIAPDGDCTAEEARVEEIVTSSDVDDTVTLQSCVMGWAAVADWKGKSPLYHSPRWRIARVKCAPGSYVLQGRA